MSNVFTLDSLREAADKEFAPFKLALSEDTTVTLRNFLQLNKTTRDAVLAAVEGLNSDDADINAKIDAATKIVELVCDPDGKKLLMKAIDGNLALLLQIINSWMGKTQLGEADNSPS